MNNNPIGVFDSGIGGLTVLEEIKRVLPKLAINYLADTKSLPLGNKSAGYILERVIKGIDFLFSRGCNLVLLACNTASVTSIRKIQQDWLKKNYKLKNVLGISFPLIEEIKQKYSFLKDEPGLIFSTYATHKTEFYESELAKIGFRYIETISSSKLVMSIEQEDRIAIGREIEKLMESSKIKPNLVKFVILASTHYPLALEEFKNNFSSETFLIDSSKTVAIRLENYLKRHSEYIVGNGVDLYWETDKSPNINEKASRILKTAVSFNSIEL